MGTIEDLVKLESSLMDQLSDVRDSLREAREKDVFEKYGVAIGDRVIDSKGKATIVVERFTFWKQGKPWASGTVVKKDGTLGTRVKTIYGDWAKVQ